MTDRVQIVGRVEWARMVWVGDDGASGIELHPQDELRASLGLARFARDIDPHDPATFPEHPDGGVYALDEMIDPVANTANEHQKVEVSIVAANGERYVGYAPKAIVDAVHGYPPALQGRRVALTATMADGRFHNPRPIDTGFVYDLESHRQRFADR